MANKYSTASVPIAGQDLESHLMGTHTFSRAQEYHQQSSVQQAAFRVVLRQEIVIAFRTQRPIQLLQKYIHVGQSLNQSDDSSVAFQIFVLCAEVLTMCYGESSTTLEAWEGINSRVQSWMDSKPITFEPLLQRHSSGFPNEDVFPEILHLTDCHGKLSFTEVTNLSC